MLFLNAVVRSIAASTLIATLAMAVPPPPGDKPLTPDLQEVRDYRLTMDKAQKFVATYKALADAKSLQCVEDNKNGALNEVEKNLGKCPGAVAIIKRTGLTPREMVVVQAALAGCLLAAAAKKEVPGYKVSSFFSPENMAFVEKNYQTLDALTKPLAKLLTQE